MTTLTLTKTESSENLIHQAYEYVDQLLGSFNMRSSNQETVRTIKLILEELIMNSWNHGGLKYQSQYEFKIQLKIEKQEGFKIIYSASENDYDFNIYNHNRPTSPDAIGGKGVLLILNFSSKVDITREKGMNHYIIHLDG